jgi:pimeloyl-ACP methyl ester carboxylesterase
MPQAMANRLCIEYETFGRARDPAILLIMGLGGQLILWPDAFCQRLAEAGHYVIRYDNRDVGLSSKCDALGKPNLVRAGLAYKLGLPVKSGYSLDDMAQDALGLLDALGIGRAHIVGASMGGMIAQILAARSPERVNGLVLVMSSSGHPRAPGPSLRIGLRLVRRPPPGQRSAHISHHLKTWQMVTSPDYPVPVDEMRAHAERSYDRAHCPQGLERQAAAIFASGNRVPLLRRIQAPTLIVHGRDDRLMPVAAAYELARHIARAKLDIVPGMGHDFPQPLIPRIAGSVLAHLGAAGRHAERSQPLRACNDEEASLQVRAA